MPGLAEKVRAFLEAPFDLNVRVAFVYLAATVALAVAIWLWRGRPGSLPAFLFPRAVYTHRSNLLDVKLFLANRIMAVGGLFGPLVFAPAVAMWTIGALPSPGLALGPDGEPGWPAKALATILILVSADFCKYAAHRLHHEWPVLWPYHAVHHSADVLTPLTVMRVHPVEIALRTVLVSAAFGLVQGVLLVAFVGPVGILTVGGANLVYVAFNAAGANLRHSHIWLSYGRVMEHVLISPAQHQVHHSVDPKHHDKNYGSIFAVWDWAFGTLYVPEVEERLTFGISDAHGTRIDAPHPTLRTALLAPFVQSAAALGGDVRRVAGRWRGRGRLAGDP